jgi:hypothetical protein
VFFPIFWPKSIAKSLNNEVMMNAKLRSQIQQAQELQGSKAARQQGSKAAMTSDSSLHFIIT